MYDRVIVPLAEDAETPCLAHARTLARDLCCELTLLHVHQCAEAPAELEALPQYRFQHVVETWTGRDLEAEAKELEWLTRLADQLSADEPKLTISTRVVHAPLGETLAAPGEEVLVIAPARDLPLDGLSWGTRELVRSGGLPVLVAPVDRALLPLRRILIALDGSDFSLEAVRPALELARATGARVSLLEVVTRYNGLARLLKPGDRTAESAERFLREVRERIPPEIGPVDVRVVEHANPAAGIVLEARREEVDLVAMATHGRGGLRRIMMGSVAESVVRSVQVPVLLFRPTAAGIFPEAGAAPVA